MTIVQRTLFPALLRALDDQRVLVLTGMRRGVRQLAVRWLLDQVPSSNKLYLDLERLDQRAAFSERNYDLILDFPA
ncbi:hypothetical protein [Candidatus Amarolinea dominans]|uniref:hypothetical protein n=1 Tax=Candidatus Amarolinea dominans TaxID=3140696 RepID=UPI003135EEC1|nr:hypothetical protein [Anaerolineae bacterium]